MVTLPNSDFLPVEHLAAGFDNVTNSYKFYWFLAILDNIQENQSRFISNNDLLAHMIAGVWYPTNYFRLSFGKQDRLGQAAIEIGAHANLQMDTKKQKVIRAVSGYLTKDLDISREIQSFGQYVPFRFLRPFFARELRGLIDTKVNESIREFAGLAFDSHLAPCLYRFTPTGIEIHPVWFNYLNRHLSILKGFCLWHLVNYVQKNNPNVPNVSGKLSEPMQRDLKQAKAFWNLVFENTGELHCIYSGQTMYKGDYSLDHFLPWRFVTHDLIWNIIPTPRNVNSAKSDNLPDFGRYFEPFAEMQHKAIQSLASKEKIPEEYALLFNVSSSAEIRTLPFNNFQETLRAAIAPQIQIAANMGFAGQWSYAK